MGGCSPTSTPAGGLKFDTWNPGTASAVASENSGPLVADPGSLSFGADTSELSLSVWHVGDAPVSFAIRGESEWLNLDVTSGELSGGSQVVHVSVDRSSLDTGIYTSAVRVEPEGYEPLRVPVSLMVAETSEGDGEGDATQLYVSTDGLDFGAGSRSISFLVRNAGGGTMDFVASSEEAWLSFTGAAGSSSGQYEAVRVDVERGALPEGEYTGKVTVRTAKQQAELSVHVSVPAGAGSALELSPVELDFGETQTRMAVVLNCGGALPASWTVTSNVAWASALTPQGTNEGDPEIVRIAVDRTGLKPGNHTGTLEVKTEFGAVGEITLLAGVPEDQPVPGPRLELSTNLLDFGARALILPFALRNAGDGAFLYTVTSEVEWATVDPAFGMNAGEYDLIYVQVSRESLAAGAYYGALTIVTDYGETQQLELMLESSGQAGDDIGDELVVWPTSDERLDYSFKMNGVNYPDEQWINTPVLSAVQISRTVENYEGKFDDVCNMLRTEAPDTVFGTILSGMDCRYSFDMYSYPREMLEFQQIPLQYFLWPYLPDVKRSTIDLRIPEAAELMADKFVDEVLSRGDLEMVLIDNIRHPLTGAYGRHNVPWSAVTNYLQDITTQLHAAGVRTIANIAIVPTYVSVEDQDALIGAVDGISMEMAFHQGWVRTDPVRLQMEFDIFRKWLDAGLQLQVTPWYIPNDGEWYDQVRFFAGMVMMMREPGDSIFVNRHPWDVVPDWVDWPERFGAALGECTIEMGPQYPIVTREFEHASVTVDVAKSLNAAQASGAVAITWR